MHLFRFEGDKIVEYWDITQQILPSMLNAGSFLEDFIGMVAVPCVRFDIDWAKQPVSSSGCLVSRWIYW